MPPPQQQVANTQICCPHLTGDLLQEGTMQAHIAVRITTYGSGRRLEHVCVHVGASKLSFVSTLLLIKHLYHNVRLTDIDIYRSSYHIEDRILVGYAVVSLGD
jgi:hypothetical protein